MAHDPSAFIQEYFQIRSGDTVGLNVDSGWAANENIDAAIGTGLPFRIRFKVRETAGGADTTGFKLQVNRNSGGWVDLDVLGGSSTPAALAVLSAQFTDGDATSTELLTSITTYVNGEGLEDNSSTNYTLTNEETEFEWCLQIQSFHDGPTQNVNSNTLDFRVVESDGTAFTGTYVNPTITVSETAGYVGGCFTETPNRVGPHADTNGNLYFAMENAHNEASFLMVKSTDGGNTWREIDGINRPTNGDLESVDMSVDGDTLHILHQGNTDVQYHRFRMSDHPTNPDTWEITDEAVTTVTATDDQSAAIQHRPDNTIVGFYQRTDGGNEDIKYKIRSSGGSWGSENNLDNTASVDFTWVAVAMGASDKIHIFYKEHTNGDVYHKSLNSSDTLSGRDQVHNDVGIGGSDRAKIGIQPVYWDDSGNEKIMVIVHDESDNYGYSSIVTNDGAPAAVVQATDNTVDYNMGGGSLAIPLVTGNIGSTVYCLYGSRADLDLWLAVYSGGSWGTDVKQQTLEHVHWVVGTVFTHSSGNGGATVFGYVYDNNSGGGTGQIWYDEYVIALGGRRVFITHT